MFEKTVASLIIGSKQHRGEKGKREFRGRVGVWLGIARAHEMLDPFFFVTAASVQRELSFIKGKGIERLPVIRDIILKRVRSVFYEGML